MPCCCCCFLLTSTTPGQPENQAHLPIPNSNSSHTLKGKHVCPALWRGFCTVARASATPSFISGLHIRSLSPVHLFTQALGCPRVVTPALGSPLVYENREMTSCGRPLGFMDFFFFLHKSLQKLLRAAVRPSRKAGAEAVTVPQATSTILRTEKECCCCHHPSGGF